MKNEDAANPLIESATRPLPSVAFLAAGMGTLALAGILLALGKRHVSLFLGQCVAPILMLGTYRFSHAVPAPALDKQHQRRGSNPRRPIVARTIPMPSPH